MSVYILRLGHRIFRDQRISTHVFLAGRAFGCAGGFYTGQKDAKLENTIAKTCEQWGGDFEIQYAESWKKLIKDFSGLKIHLSVYGIPFQNKLNEIRNKIKKEKNLLIIVGGEKVPPEVYQLADYNLAVTSQPHSEVSALAVFLHEFFGGRELNKDFNGKLKVIPQERGKKVTDLNLNKI